ncbi:hypothetical protein [Spartinivicinus poritis]|uniref:Uncharacterized protein n=1 Tax=Spartinivicinus poritis TaxID=2994640 RepID=A0ABT5UCX3_9GAMM|nr:hypothetical protein [Spartinivicinus sp. A2-2]MDE1464228.1 hypothetical protein [Spartinivicinus sp. A2-2]
MMNDAVVTYIDLSSIIKKYQNAAVLKAVKQVFQHNVSKELNIYCYNLKGAIVRVRPLHHEYNEDDIKLLVLHELLALEHIQGLLFSFGDMLHSSTAYGEFRIANNSMSGAAIESSVKLIAKQKFNSRILLSSEIVNLIKAETQDFEIRKIAKHIKGMLIRSESGLYCLDQFKIFESKIGIEFSNDTQEEDSVVQEAV